MVGHNVPFDLNVVGAELLRQGWINTLVTRRSICTMREGTEYCRIPGKYGYKWPTLTELHLKLFGREFESAHDAMSDTLAGMKCYFELKKKKHAEASPTKCPGSCFKGFLAGEQF